MEQECTGINKPVHWEQIVVTRQFSKLSDPRSRKMICKFCTGLWSWFSYLEVLNRFEKAICFCELLPGPSGLRLHQVQVIPAQCCHWQGPGGIIWVLRATFGIWLLSLSDYLASDLEVTKSGQPERANNIQLGHGQVMVFKVWYNLDVLKRSKITGRLSS